MKSICICGGGNLGHVVAGYLSARHNMEVNLLTGHPGRWQQTIEVTTPEGRTLEGRLARIAQKAAEVVPQSDMCLLCLPGFAIGQALRDIRPHLAPGVPVGSIVSSTGFFFEAMKALDSATPLFGFQRVPFIARTESYGSRAHLLGYKPSLSMATAHCNGRQSQALAGEVSRMFDTPVHLLDSYYEASLTNSNPLLHTARLYSMWWRWQPGTVYAGVPQFYSDWTDEASALLVAMDSEFMQLLGALHVTPGSVPTVLDYYESTDAASLTRKLRSIAAFKGILSPMKKVGDAFVPDFSSRYFTEDFPYGLAIIHRLAHAHGIDAPHIDRVYGWGTRMLEEAGQTYSQ